MEIEYQAQFGLRKASSNYLGKNILGTILILLLAVSLTVFIIWPDIEHSLLVDRQTQDIMEWVYVWEGLFIIGFVILFPLFLVVQAIWQYQQAK
jgi:TRAP-type mannitol/chloroaromatic compound transport system permease small subunit